MKKINNALISVFTTIIILLGIFFILFSLFTTPLGSNIDYFTFLTGISLMLIGLIILFLSIKNKILRAFLIITTIFTIIFSILIISIPEGTGPLIQCPSLGIELESTDPANHSIDFIITSINPDQEYNAKEFGFILVNDSGNFTDFEITFEPNKIAIGTYITIKTNESDNYELKIVYTDMGCLVSSPKKYYI